MNAKWGRAPTILLGLTVACFGSCSGSATQPGPSGTGGGGGFGAGGAGGMPADPGVVASCKAYCAQYPDACLDCGQLSPVMSSCMARCKLETTCNPNYSTADCIWYRCTNTQLAGAGSIDTLPPTCQAAWKAYFDCLVTQKVPCDPVNVVISQPGDCETEAFAVLRTCPS